MRSCLICDDHALLREALAGLIAARWPAARIVQAANFPEAWELAGQGHDLCLVDLEMPGADPRTGIETLLAAAPNTRVVVVTGSYDDALLVDLLGRGVAGFAPKQLTGPVLLAAIELVLAGGRYLPARLAELQLSPPEAERSLRPAAVVFSARQMEVLSLLVMGRTNKDIARTLEVSPATVKTHVAQIIALTGAANRTEAAMRAKALGLI